MLIVVQMLEPSERLGCEEMGGYAVLKQHPFFKDINWETLADQDAPELVPFLPGKTGHEDDLWSNYQPGLNDKLLSRLIANDLHVCDTPPQTPPPTASVTNNTAPPAESSSQHKIPKEL